MFNRAVLLWHSLAAALSALGGASPPEEVGLAERGGRQSSGVQDEQGQSTSHGGAQEESGQNISLGDDQSDGGQEASGRGGRRASERGRGEDVGGWQKDKALGLDEKFPLRCRLQMPIKHT